MAMIITFALSACDAAWVSIDTYQLQRTRCLNPYSYVLKMKEALFSSKLWLYMPNCTLYLFYHEDRQ